MKVVWTETRPHAVERSSIYGVLTTYYFRMRYGKISPAPVLTQTRYIKALRVKALQPITG